jgi:DNA-binding MarR family transcriptional regulator
MNTKIESDAEARRRRRHLVLAVKASLRAANNQIALLNHQVSTRVELRDVDLDCLDFIAQHGPVSPTTLAKSVGLHPATMTGILDRLERGGWVTRDRDQTDRRGIQVRVLPERNADLLALYAGMDSALDGVCAKYSEAELSTIADFLARSAEAGHASTASMSVHGAG